MKLRQKLAVVMASAMVVTAVPVVTMAASSNTMFTQTKVVTTNSSFSNADDASKLDIKFSNAKEDGKETFYLTLENAKWNADTFKTVFNGSDEDLANKQFVVTDAQYQLLTTASNIKATLTIENDRELKVELTGIEKDDIFRFPILAKEINSDAKVKINADQADTSVSSSEFIFATTAEKKLNFTVGDMKTVYETGEIAEITLSEAFKGALDQLGEVAIDIELKDADYEFDDIASATAELTHGFRGQDSAIKVEFIQSKDDLGAVTVKITKTGDINEDSIGRIALKGLKVKNTSKDIVAGDLLVDIKNAPGYNALGNGATNVKVADVTAYGSYIQMKDNKAVDTVAGRTRRIEFKVGENIKDSFRLGREFEITLDNGAYFNYKTGANLTSDTYVNNDGLDLIDSIRVDKDDNNKLIVKLKDDASLKDKKQSMVVTLDVNVPVSAKDNETITITASGRALAEDVSTTAINVVNPFNVTTTSFNVKVGLQNQVGGKITLEETEKEMLMKGNLEFKVVDPTTGEAVSGIKFYNKDFVEFSVVEGDIKKADLEAVNGDGTTSVKIKRQSNSASTLELKDFHISVDRTVPEGKYDLVLTGSAITDHVSHIANDDTCKALKEEEDKKVDAGTMTDAERHDAAGSDFVHYTDKDQADLHKVVVKDFLVVGTPNTEDLTVNGLRKGTVEFKVGESKYTANGEAVAMDAASYIADPGYTMIPVRYVAESFGIGSKDILFSNGTVTILTGSRTVQLTNNSDIAIVNGAKVKMGTKVVIKDGRTYAPVGEVARILGVTTSWDNVSKTATFTN